MQRLLLIAVLFNFYFLSAQNKSEPLDCHKKIAPRLAGGSEKLAHSLTDHLSSDSDKICAIYSWITANIAYDIHKVAINDFKRVQTAKIIRKQKAICLGYADLFNELCKYAGIESVTVIGYVKTRGVDVGDVFYYSTHAWNAAKIDGRWMLFDATWDAGYINYVRQTWKGKLIAIFTLGKVQRFYFKPKFEQDPGTSYFFKTGEYFSYDHLAADPAWQLRDSAIHPEKWRLDSSYYYGKEPEENSGSDATDNYAYQDYFAALSDEDQWIAMGKAAYRANRMNHVDIALAYGMMGLQSITEMVKDNISDPELAKLTIAWHDTALMHYDSAIMMLKKQKLELSEQRKKKRKICTDYNKQIIVKCKKELGYLKHSLSAMEKVVKDINKFEVNSHIAYTENIRNGFRRAPWSAGGETKDAKIEVLDSILGILDDTLEKMKVQIMVLQKQIYRIWDKHEDMIQDVRDNNQEDLDFIQRRAMARMFGADDLDYIPSAIRDSLMMHKLQDDSTLLINGSPLSDSLPMLLSSFVRLSKGIHKVYGKEMALWVKKKSYSTEDPGMQEDYMDFEKEYYDYRKGENEWTAEWIKPMKAIEDDLNDCFEIVQALEPAWALVEIKLEKKLDKGRAENANENIDGTKKGLKENKDAVKKNRKIAVALLKEMQRN